MISKLLTKTKAIFQVMHPHIITGMEFSNNNVSCTLIGIMFFFCFYEAC